MHCQYSISYSVTIFIAIAALLWSCLTRIQQQSQCKSKLDLLISLYGREKEQMELLTAIKFHENKVIDVVGIVGIGKTTLVQNTTDILVEKCGYCAIYIDILEHTHISAVKTRLVSDHRCISNYYSLMLTFNEWYYGLDNPLQSWLRYLQPHTILILDNAQAMTDAIDQNITSLLPMSQSITVIQISPYCDKKYLMQPVIQLKGMNPEVCAHWIDSEHKLISYQAGLELCSELGGVPHDIKSIAVYASHPLTAGSIQDVIAELKSHEYGRSFMYVESILGSNYKETEQRNKAMYFLYDQLGVEHRECIWLLVEMIGNHFFTRDLAREHLAIANISVDDCLDALLLHSFLESTVGAQKTFKFRSHVIKFIEYLEKPLGDPKCTIKRMHVLRNYVYNHTKARFFELEKTQNLSLAIDIGSNRELVNSFLQILGDKYELKSLFKLAYRIIQEHFCMPNSLFNKSNAKALLAFSYLTKALHCASFHAPAFLLPSKPKLLQSCSCLQKLVSCNTIVSIEDAQYETADALGYYNSLLIYAYDSVPWRLNLTDLSYMVIAADHECAYYCKHISFCECGTNSTIENGLRQFVLKNFVRSVQFFEATLKELSRNNQQCQTVLKLIAIAGVYASRSNNSVEFAHYLNDINFHNINMTCYLGVFSDLILPFLVEIEHEMTNHLKKQLNKFEQEEETICSKRQRLEVDCSPKTRYTAAKGITALKMTKLQKLLNWPKEVTEYISREEWVCAIIRDKITKCKEDLPLYSLVMPLEAEKNKEKLQILKDFMKREEYEKLEEILQNIPHIFELMSI